MKRAWAASSKTWQRAKFQLLNLYLSMLSCSALRTCRSMTPSSSSSLLTSPSIRHCKRLSSSSHSFWRCNWSAASSRGWPLVFITFWLWLTGKFQSFCLRNLLRDPYLKIRFGQLPPLCQSYHLRHTCTRKKRCFTGENLVFMSKSLAVLTIPQSVSSKKKLLACRIGL